MGLASKLRGFARSGGGAPADAPGLADSGAGAPGTVPGGRALAVLAAAAALTLAFVFAHSLQGSAGSWAESDAVAGVLGPVLGGLHSLYLGVAAHVGFLPSLDCGAFVRKAAHFSEYALLGAECAAIVALLARRVLSPHLWACLFATLFAAVLDEFAQSFVGRTSLVGDVLLDFSGGLAGIALALAATALARRRSESRIGAGSRGIGGGDGRPRDRNDEPGTHG